MALTNFLRDSLDSGPLALPGSGNVTYDIPIPTDRVVRLFAVTMCGTSGSGHITNGAAVCAEAVFKNNNGTVTLCAATGSSANPMNSNSTNYYLAHAQASDLSISALWTVSSTNARLTISNGTATAQDAVMFVDMWEVGYA